MTEKEMKKLRRVDLLEMLLEQTRRVEALEKEVAELKSRFAERRLDIEQAGSLAEACIKINDVLKAADAAAEQYLYNIRLKASEGLKEGTEEEEEAEKAAKEEAKNDG